MEKNKITKSSIKKVSVISLLSVLLITSVISCFIVKSGKDGKDGVDGKTTPISIVDDQVNLDGKETIYGNDDRSSIIEVSANNIKYGNVEGSGQYSLNSAVMISCTPNPGYVFLRWENQEGIEVSKEPSFIVRASVEKQKYIAILDIDKTNIKIEVHCRLDQTFSSSYKVLGSGTYRYNEEYTFRIETIDSTDLTGGTIYFYEVSEEQYKDEQFVIDSSLKACARGNKATFKVTDIENKYYIAHYEKSSDAPITIVKESHIVLESSNEKVGIAKIIKKNNEDIINEDINIWPGDLLVAKASPLYALMNVDSSFSNLVKFPVYRSSFAYWLDMDSGEIYSTNEEISFIAKEQMHLKAIFVPKAILHFKADDISIRILTKNAVINNPLESYVFDGHFNSPIASFDFGEELFIYAKFLRNSSISMVRNTKFKWLISYDEMNYSTLSYDEQAYFTIPDDTLDIYLTVSYDKA